LIVSKSNEVLSLANTQSMGGISDCQPLHGRDHRLSPRTAANICITNTRPTSNTTGNDLIKFTCVQLNERVVTLQTKTVTADALQSFVNSESFIKSTNNSCRHM